MIPFDYKIRGSFVWKKLKKPIIIGSGYELTKYPTMTPEVYINLVIFKNNHKQSKIWYYNNYRMWCLNENDLSISIEDAIDFLQTIKKDFQLEFDGFVKFNDKFIESKDGKIEIVDKIVKE